MRGHVFHIQSNRAFVPHEFREGEASSQAAEVPGAFFQELAEFLRLNNFTDLVALQLSGGPRDQVNTEFLVVSQSTRMMNTEDVLELDPARITMGWHFRVNEDGVISCKGNDV